MAGRSTILMYHSLDNSGSVISARPEVFRRQMEFLAASRIPVVPLAEALQRAGSVAITFDDGFRNVLDHAVPALARVWFPGHDFCGQPILRARSTTGPRSRKAACPNCRFSTGMS